MKDLKRSEPCGRSSPLEALEEMEELDERLENVLPMPPGLGAQDLCVWACACFLVDGG